jgi:hypothetical protein
MLLSRDDFMRAMRDSDVRTALHGLAQSTVPFPWGKEDGPGTFFPTDYLLMNDPSKKAADAVAREAHRQAEIDLLRRILFRRMEAAEAKEKESEKPSVDLKPRPEVDKQRTIDILQAMIRYVQGDIPLCADKAIPEEWMDELSDLVWRERDRLGANTGD